MDSQKKWVISVAIVCLALSLLLDPAILRLVEDITPGALLPLFEWFSSLQSMLIVLLVMTSLFLWEEKKGSYIAPLFVSVIFALFVVYLLKFSVQRGRPDEIVTILGFIDYSFPSAHAAIGFATIPILDREFPKLKWFWIVFAVLIGLSRLVLGMHYLSDVIAGGIIGYLCGYFVLRLEIKGNPNIDAGDEDD